MTVTHLDSARSGGRRPPHDLQAEASLLGGVLFSKDTLAIAAETLRPDDFYKPAHAHIFDAATALAAAGQPADPITVADELRRAGLLDAIGGVGLLVQLHADGCVTSSATRYAKIVADHALMRRMIGVAGEIAELGYDLPGDAGAALDDAEARIFALAERRATSDTVAPIGGLLDNALDRLEQLMHAGDNTMGLRTGFTDLDTNLCGLQPAALYVIGGRPSQGKTALALNIAAHAALDANAPTLVFSLEMSQIELTQRLLCSESRVDSQRIRNGQLTDSDWSKIADGTRLLADAPLWIDDNPHLTIMEIRARARRMQAKVGQLGLVVVDYLQLMTGRSSAESRQVEVSEISRGLKILARELNCPIIALSQLSRGLEQRMDKRPMLADLRESGSLEQDADVVMFVYRDEVYKPDSPDRGTAEIIVAKQRNGPVGTTRLSFLAHYTKFVNLARGGV